jgi:hypothetical protein
MASLILNDMTAQARLIDNVETIIRQKDTGASTWISNSSPPRTPGPTPLSSRD